MTSFREFELNMHRKYCKELTFLHVFLHYNISEFTGDGNQIFC